MEAFLAAADDAGVIRDLETMAALKEEAAIQFTSAHFSQSYALSSVRA